jgi:two-component system, NtrC family, sensor kinase
VQRQEHLPRASKKALSRLLTSFEPDRSQEVVECCLRELVRYYRHSGVGRSCRGIVHQMNTPLQVLSLELELLEQKSQEEFQLLPASEPQAGAKLEALRSNRQHRFQQCRQELEKLQSFARTLAREGVHEESEGYVYLDLNQLCQEELELFQANPFFKHDVKKVFSFAADLPPLHGHYIDFSQSFRNLVDNALEAMAGAEARRLTVQTSVQDHQRVLHIGDSGSGIPREKLPLIFEPFFTTKGEDRAGLGLFMARRLLAPYGGKIQVASRPGETCFSVWLPIS